MAGKRVTSWDDHAPTSPDSEAKSDHPTQSAVISVVQLQTSPLSTSVLGLILRAPDLLDSFARAQVPLRDPR